MSRLTDAQLGTNMSAFLDMIAFAEIGPGLLAISDDGYNVIVGSTAKNPILFDSYITHPRRYQRKQNSDAAGRYQFMGRYWAHYRDQLGLRDFGPESQDWWAVQLIRECRAVGLIAAGEFDLAVNACKSRWASLPGAGYGQHEYNLTTLAGAYRAAGGTFADPETTQPGVNA